MVLSNTKIGELVGSVGPDQTAQVLDQLLERVRRSPARSGLQRRSLAAPGISHALPGRESLEREDIAAAMPMADDKLEDFAAPGLGEAMERPLDLEKVCIYPWPLDEDQLGTVGFDLGIGRLIARCDEAIDNVTEKDLREMEHKVLDRGEPYEFEPNPDGDNFYYATSFEKVRVGEGLELLVDSRSTTGRLGCVVEEAGRTKDGEIITRIRPFSFPLKVVCGKSRLSQAVIRYRNSPYMTNEQILASEQIKYHGVNLRELLNSHGMVMKFKTDRVFKAKPYKGDEMPPIDVDGNVLDWRPYYTEEDGNSEICVKKKTLYLLGSEGVIELGAVCGLLSKIEGVMNGNIAFGCLAGVIQPFWKGGLTMEYMGFSNGRIKRGSKAGYLRFDRVEGDFDKSAKEEGYFDQEAPALPRIFAK